MKAAAANRRNKHLVLDDTKLKQARKLLGTRTDTETIELALDEVIQDRERNKQVWAATERLLKSGIQVHDVFGRLAEE